MKAIIILFVAVATAQALVSKSQLDKEWKQFKLDYNRFFRSVFEENYRKQVFAENLELIEKHNERYNQGLVTYRLGVTKYSDQTEEEFMSLFSSQLIFQEQEEKHGEEVPNFDDKPEIFINEEIPDALDWRDYDIVTPVKDQGQCGSCWAFAAVGVVEAHIKLYRNVTAILSEQQLVDCVDGSSCAGGSTSNSLIYIGENGGINYESDYPYEAQNGECRYDSNKPKQTTTGRYTASYGNSEKLLMAKVATKGPVAMAVTVVASWAQVKDGIFYEPDPLDCDPQKTNHVIVVVGYGTDKETGLDYWIIKNSWGAKWGDNGYIKIARNKNNQCGIGESGWYPTL